MQAMHVRTVVCALHIPPPPHSASYKTSAHLYVCTLVNTWLVEEKPPPVQVAVDSSRMDASRVCTLINALVIYRLNVMEPYILSL